MALERGPLFRARLLRRSDREHVLVLTVHHAVADFWSVAVMLNDLEESYSAEQAGRSGSCFPRSTRRIATTSIGNRSCCEARRSRRCGPIGSEQLHGAPLVLELHGDRARPPVQTFRGATCWCDDRAVGRSTR